MDVSLNGESAKNSSNPCVEQSDGKNVGEVDVDNIETAKVFVNDGTLSGKDDFL